MHSAFESCFANLTYASSPFSWSNLFAKLFYLGLADSFPKSSFGETEEMPNICVCVASTV